MRFGGMTPALAIMAGLASMLACSAFDAAGSDTDTPGSPAPLTGPGVVVAARQARPMRIALDADAVYWRNAGESIDGGPQLAEILKLPRDKEGAAPIQLAKDIRGGAALAIDRDFVYWGSGEPCGAPVPIRRVKKDGSSNEGVSGGCMHNDVGELVVDAADLFFLFGKNQGLARSHPPNPPSTIASGAAAGLAVDKLSVYFGQPSATNLVRIDKGDVTNAVSVFASLQRVVAIATDDTAVYWVTENNTVARLDRDKPATPATILAADQPSPTAIALTSTHVLWTTAGDGTVRRIAKTGGTPEVIATGQEDPVAIAADDNGIYWLNRGPGTVVRVGK